jgi:DNA polymerase-3 subunit epsilon
MNRHAGETQELPLDMGTELLARAIAPSDGRLRQRHDGLPVTEPPRTVVLDTETTGLNVGEGHRVIEIGCIELIHGLRTGKTFHVYLNPDRSVPPEATAIHGRRDADLAAAPRFAEIGRAFIEFVYGAVLVIHNAPFDLGFLDAELARAGSERSLTSFVVEIVDTLMIARELHPGQRHDLRSLCRHYGVDTAGAELHGALADAALLTSLYCEMRLSQASLSLSLVPESNSPQTGPRLTRTPLRVQQPTAAERAAHEQFLDHIDSQCPAGSLWRRLRP